MFNGFGCTGKERLAGPQVVGRAQGDEELRLLRSRSRRADRWRCGWWHWVVINVPPTAPSSRRTRERATDRTCRSGAAQVNTDFGGPGWGGPCPPAGDKPHRYNFTLRAEGRKLDVPANATASLAGFMVNANSSARPRSPGSTGRAE